MQKTWGDQMAWLSMWNDMKVAFQLTVQTIPVLFRSSIADSKAVEETLEGIFDEGPA